MHDDVRDAIAAQVLSKTLVHVRREVMLNWPGPLPQGLHVDYSEICKRALADVVVTNSLCQGIIWIAATHV